MKSNPLDSFVLSQKGLFPSTINQKDWSSPENRGELFNKYYNWRVWAKDLDHNHYMEYMCKDYTFEQKAWFCFCFGMTYRTPQAFAYTETFENINLVTEEWHKANWKRTTYGTDARYNKGHFFNQVKSIKEWLNGETFESKIMSIIVYDTEKENFWALYKEILELYKFGRMTSWLAMQALHCLLKLPIDPEQIMLEGYSPNNDSSLCSIWNGLCAYTNQPEKMVGKYGTYTCTKKDVEWADEFLVHYTKAAEKEGGFVTDSYRRESIWCQYKRLFNGKESKEYAGHASGDATSRYMYYREHWPEIDWSSFRLSLREQPGNVSGMTYTKWMNEIFGKTGMMINLHELFPEDFVDVYKALDINPYDYKVKEIWTDDNMRICDVRC